MCSRRRDIGAAGCITPMSGLCRRSTAIPAAGGEHTLGLGIIGANRAARDLHAIAQQLAPDLAHTIHAEILVPDHPVAGHGHAQPG